MRWNIVIAVLVVAGILVWALRPRPVPADFAPVERGPLRVTIDEEGRTRVRDRYVVSAPVPGLVHRIALEPGDRVTAGETVLAVFEPADPALLDVRTRAELEARVRAAEAAVGAARADRERISAELEFARTELDRYQNLLERGVVSRERVEVTERQVRNLEEGLRSAEFGVHTAEHQLELARAGFLQARDPRESDAAIRLRAPVNGVVLRRLQESEAVVAIGHPLLEIGDLRQLEIVADLLSTAAVQVEPGQRVLIEQWGGNTTLKGRVQRVEPSGFTKISALGVEEQRVNTIIEFDDPETTARHLGDAYRVEVRIVVWEHPDVLKVPVGSLFRHEGQWAVYRVEDDTAVQRPVRIGQRSGLEAEVLEGLAEGDRVIIYPGQNVRDGVTVEARSW